MSFIVGIICGYAHLVACVSMRLNPDTKLPITLAAHDLNRLTLKDGRIAAVYGADLFHVELDTKHGQVFLHLKQDVNLPGQVSLAITTEDGLTQDLEVFFTEDPATPIIFHKPKEQVSRRQEALQFFHEVLSGKTDGTILQEGTPVIPTNLGWGTMTLKHRILSPNLPFVVEYYDIAGHKPYCQYNIRHDLFTKNNPAVHGVWLSARTVQGKKPITVALLKTRGGV